MRHSLCSSGASYLCASGQKGAPSSSSSSLTAYKLKPLPQDEAKALVRAFLDTYHKKLCEDESNGLLGDQMAVLMSKEEADTPL